VARGCPSARYRQSVPTFARALEARLSPFGFATVEPDEGSRALGILIGYHRRTWNTNRAVFLAQTDPRDPAALGAHVEALRRESGRVFGSSWWSQLGLQLVLEVSGTLPSQSRLQGLVARYNTQEILVQSLFAVEPSTLERTSARTWGQVVTGKFQDAIARAIEDVALARAPARASPER